MHPPTTVSLRSFFSAAVQDRTIQVRDNLFLPDTWTKTFAQGLQQIASTKPCFKDQTILEVGVGTGVNMAGLLSLPTTPQGFIGTDICADAIAASSAFAEECGFTVQLLQSDLLKDVPEAILSRVDHIVACIPQVPKPPAIDLRDGDNFAHYYDPCDCRWDEFGLGLVANLLKQTAEKTHAGITLNLSGRPGVGRLKAMFGDYGFQPEITYSRMVPQHAETSLASLAALEHDGHDDFEFYADEAGQEPLNARAAEERRLAAQPLYHYIHVISAPALSR